MRNDALATNPNISLSTKNKSKLKLGEKKLIKMSKI